MLKRVYLEITNICNLQCAFCLPHHRSPQSMTPEFFRSAVRQVKEFTPYIYLHVKGEPLLHPQFDEIMQICDEEKMEVQLVTNASRLSLYSRSLLQHPSLRKISFSLQSIEYQKTDPLALLENVLAFCREASQHERPYCEIRFWRNDQLSDPATKQCLSYLGTHFHPVSSGRQKNYRIMNHVYVDFDNTFSWPEGSDPEQGDTGTCHGALHQIAVLSDGRVVPCCLDQDAAVCFGSLKETDLRTILMSERYLTMTEGLRRGKLTESFCRRCTFRLRFSKPQTTSR